MPFASHIVVSILTQFLVAFHGAIPSSANGMIMLLINMWVFFSSSKVWIVVFNCSNCYHNSKALLSNFLAQDSMSYKCPNNSMTYFSAYFALTFNSTTYIWCSTSSSKPHLSMTFIRASSRLFQSITWFVSMFSTVPRKSCSISTWYHGHLHSKIHWRDWAPLRFVWIQKLQMNH